MARTAKTQSAAQTDDVPMAYADWKKLRIGYLKSEFDPPEPLKLA